MSKPKTRHLMIALTAIMEFLRVHDPELYAQAIAESESADPLSVEVLEPEVVS